jgi:predicted small integral membrane protein
VRVAERAAASFGGAMIDDTTEALRLAPLVLVAGITLMSTLVVFGNVTDPRSNLQFIERIMSMDSTYRSPRLMWRAIRSAALHKIAFGFIVVLETLVAITGWIGTVQLISHLDASADAWHAAKHWAVIALVLALVVWHLVFEVGGNEWFASWQSERWKANEQTPGINLITIGALVLLAVVH